MEYVTEYDMIDKGGRPALYNNSETLDKKIEEYFESIKGTFELVNRRDEDGNSYEEKVWTKAPEPATITGLCLYLGFESRQSFYDYEKRDGFSYTIKKAKLRIENSYEVSGLNTKTPTFHIFALKNLGWSDKQEIDHTTGGDKINQIVREIVKASD